MDLSYLANLSETQFEAERYRLIKAEIEKAPTPVLKKKALALQFELDALRETLSTEDFLQSIAHRIRDNLENIEDQIQYAKSV